MKRNIIAVVGMCGVGKSVVCEHLVNLGYHKLYFGGITYKLMQEQGIERTPESERVFREKLREEHGKECYAKFIYPEILENEDKNIVLDGLYSWYEYKYLKERLQDNLTLICVVADKQLRYDNIAVRKERPFTNDEAKIRDESEIENLYKGGPIAYADYYIFNKYTDEIHERIDEILEEINNK